MIQKKRRLSEEHPLFIEMQKLLLIISITFNLFFLTFSTISQPIEEKNELEKIFIRNINFNGNSVIETKLLNTILGISPGQIFSQTQLESGLINILNAYKNLGYLFAKVSYESVPIALDQVIINISIIEGEFVGMGKIDLSGEYVFPKEQLLKMFNIRNSRVFNEDMFNNDIDRLIKFYSENGYPLMKISVEKVNIEDSKINIIMNIQAGSIIRIKNFEVNGLRKTKKDVILREMTFKPGDVFDQRKIDESFRRLNNMGYFQSVSPISFSSDEDGFVSLATDLIEGRTGRFSGLLGYNPSEEAQNGNKLIGSLELMETNLFGTGRKVLMKARLGSTDVYEFSYTEPWIFGSPIDAGVQIRSINRTDNLLNHIFSEREFICEGKSRIFRMISLSTGIIYKKIDSSKLLIQEYDSNEILPYYSENKEFNDNIAEGRKYGVIFTVQRDSRDYYKNPSFGRFDRLSTEISRGDFKLFKLWLDLNQYFQILDKQILALGLHGAKVWGEKIPPPELLYLGGANTLRGYKEDIFRGNAKILANCEYRFLIGRDSNFFLFLDAGTVYKDYKLDPIKIGYGAGIRLESASGMISLDYGLARGDSILNGKIHVSLGATF